MIKCQDTKIKYRRILLTLELLILHIATSIVIHLGINISLERALAIAHLHIFTCLLPPRLRQNARTKPCCMAESDQRAGCIGGIGTCAHNHWYCAICIGQRPNLPWRRALKQCFSWCHSKFYAEKNSGPMHPPMQNQIYRDVAMHLLLPWRSNASSSTMT